MRVKKHYVKVRIGYWSNLIPSKCVRKRMPTEDMKVKLLHCDCEVENMSKMWTYHRSPYEKLENEGKWQPTSNDMHGYVSSNEFHLMPYLRQEQLEHFTDYTKIVQGEGVHLTNRPQQARPPVHPEVFQHLLHSGVQQCTFTAVEGVQVSGRGCGYLCVDVTPVAMVVEHTFHVVTEEIRDCAPHRPGEQRRNDAVRVLVVGQTKFCKIN